MNPGQEKNKPLISVIIPCYNSGRYLEEAIQSVENTPFKDYELIIVNDGSTDEDTIRLFSRLEKKGYNILHQENKGVSAARNAGIAIAQSSYILPLDADNKITPAYYQKAVRLMEDDPEIGVVYADRVLFGEKEEVVQSTGDFNAARLLTGNYIDACAVYRKSVWEKNKGYDEQIPGGFYEDWEFWIHAYGNGFRFYHLPEPLFWYREQDHSLKSKALDPSLRFENVKYIVTKHHEVYQPFYPLVISRLHETLSNWDRRSKEIESRVAVITAAFEEERSAYKTEADQLRALLEASEKNIRALQSDIDARVLEISRLQAICETLEGEKTALQAASGELKSKLHTAEAEKNLFMSNIRELDKMILQLEERIRSMENTKTWRLRNKLIKIKRVFGVSGAKKSGRFKGFIKKVFFIFYKNGGKFIRKALKTVFKKLYLWLEDVPVKIIYGSEKELVFQDMDPYTQYRMKHILSEDEVDALLREMEGFEYKPLISIIIPVYNTPERFLFECLDSVVDQYYENIEICIADDCSSNPQIRKIIESYRKRDYRIKVAYREKNGHISECSNTALSLATGEYCVLVDHDDRISRDCVFELVKALNKEKADLIYSDEDKLDPDGKHTNPYFKPDWAKDSFYTKNYLCHVSCIRKSLVDEVGGFRVGFEGAQDYDLLLRISERANTILHIPKILYHWRMHEQSTAMEGASKSYAYIAGQRALQEALARNNESGEVEIMPNYAGYSVRYKINHPGKVSIFIPTKNNASVIKTCIDSIYEKSTYTNFELIVVSNNSDETELFSLLEAYRKKQDNFTWFELNEPFNFSKLMNACAAKATGKYYLLLNNDMEVISPDWIEGMVEQCQRKEIGAAGAKLLYPNDHVQHAGVVIGISGVAGHIFTGFHKTHYGYFGNLMSITNYSAVTGACLMCRKEVFDEVGGFTEEFTVEYNDTDFCLKILDAGYRNVYLPHVLLYHYESLTRGHPFATKSSYEKHLREVKLFKDRWQKYIDRDPYYNPNLSLKKADYSIKQ